LQRTPRDGRVGIRGVACDCDFVKVNVNQFPNHFSVTMFPAIAALFDGKGEARAANVAALYADKKIATGLCVGQINFKGEAGFVFAQAKSASATTTKNKLRPMMDEREWVTGVVLKRATKCSRADMFNKSSQVLTHGIELCRITREPGAFRATGYAKFYACSAFHQTGKSSA
jgi:hypothetical protein